MSDAKPSTVAEIRAMPASAVVYCFTGTVVKRLGRKDGENSRGAWSLESLDVRDDAADVIKVTLKDCEPMDPAITAGKRVIFTATQSQQHGWIGVKAKDDTYKEKTTRILWVTSSATTAAPSQSPPVGQSATPATGGTRRPAASSGDPVKDAINLLSRLSNLERLCLRSTVHIAEEWQLAYGKPMDADLFQSINSSFWIKCKDQGVYLDLPTEPMPIKRPQQKGTR